MAERTEIGVTKGQVHEALIEALGGKTDHLTRQSLVERKEVIAGFSVKHEDAGGRVSGGVVVDGLAEMGQEASRGATSIEFLSDEFCTTVDVNALVLLRTPRGTQLLFVAPESVSFAVPLSVGTEAVQVVSAGTVIAQELYGKSPKDPFHVNDRMQGTIVAVT